MFDETLFVIHGRF